MKAAIPRSLLITLALLAIPALSSCDFLKVDEVVSPNNPSVEAVREGATRGQLQRLVTGLEDRHRQYAQAWDILGVFGREALAYFASDPRFVTVWMGMEEPASAEDSPQFFAADDVYNGPYRAIKQANLLIEAVQNTDAVTEAETNGYLGFARTIKAFQYVVPLNTQFQNGIRIDVSDPLNPGPFLSYEDALAAIRTLLDEAAQDLQNAGSTFTFELSNGFAGFATPQGMLQVNRAVAARVALYAEDWQGALDALEGSFLQLEGGPESLLRGPAHVYGPPPDVFNPYYRPPNVESNQILMVHPDMLADALPGDERVPRKFFKRDEPVSNPDIPESALYQDNRWASDSAPIPFIRNEELILIYAEAHAQLGHPIEAVNAIDLIRTTWGLDPYTGPTDTAALIDEILFQRRYSLWCEGHRWFDTRRYGRLDELPTPYGGRIFTQLARPLAEVNWEEQDQ